LENNIEVINNILKMAAVVPASKNITRNIDDSVVNILKKIIEQKGKRGGLTNAEKEKFRAMIDKLVRAGFRVDYEFKQFAGYRRSNKSGKSGRNGSNSRH
jgi:hypothetical protein